MPAELEALYPPMRVGPYGAIYLRNFKCFGPVGQCLPLSRINLFFGPNSSGKSSVFQAIGLMIDAAFGRALNLRWSTTVHRGRLSQTVVVGLTFRNPRILEEHQARTMYFRFRGSSDDRMILDGIDIALDHAQKVFLLLQKINHRLVIRELKADSGSLKAAIPALREQGLSEQALGSLRSALRGQAVSMWDDFNLSLAGLGLGETMCDAVSGSIGNAIGHSAIGLMDLGRNYLHLGPVRRIPDRDELIRISSGGRVHGLGGAEKEMWSSLLSQPANSRYLREINGWIGKLGTDLGYWMKTKSTTTSARKRQGGRYLVLEQVAEPRWRRVQLDLNEVGVGVSQVIPVVASACYHSGMWLALEQPELHLHPRAQCGLADVFIAKTKDYPYVQVVPNYQNVFLIETHSEHLLLRILRRIRETGAGRLGDREYLNVRPEEVAIHYFNRILWISLVHRLEITPEGDFSSPWPEGFFDERAKELFD